MALGVSATSAQAQLLDCGPEIQLSRFDPDSASHWEIEVVPPYAFVSGDYLLRVLDISDPANPLTVTKINPGSISRVMARSGSTLYISDLTRASFVVVDVSNPIEPTVIPDTVPDFETADLLVHGRYLYAAENEKTTEEILKVIDISDPLNPLQTASVPTPAYSYGGSEIAISRGHLYLSASDYRTSNHELFVFSLADPAHPVLLGTVDNEAATNPDAYYGLTIVGDFLYASSGKSLIVHSLANPATPVVTRVIRYDGYPHTQFTRGDKAFVLVSESISINYIDRLDILDVSNPEAPKRLALYPLGYNYNRSLDVYGTHAYVAAGYGGSMIYDLSQLAGPTTIQEPSSTSKFDLGFGFDAEGNDAAAYLADGSGGLRVFGPLSDANPREIASLRSGGFALNLDLSGDLLAVANGTDGLRLFDVSSHDGIPSQLGALDDNGYPYDVVLRNDLAFVADYLKGLRVIDAADPSFPATIATLKLPGYPTDLAIDADRAYVATAETGLEVVDLTSPSSPVWLASVGSAGVVNDVEAETRGGLRIAYLADSVEGLRVLDLSDPSNPVTLATRPTAGNASAVDLDGDRLLVSDNSGTVTAYNITDPTSPTLQFVIDGLVNAQGLSAHGDRVFAARGKQGFVVLNLFKNCCYSVADFSGDRVLASDDIHLFIDQFLNGAPVADLNNDGAHDHGDIVSFVTLFLAGC